MYSGMYFINFRKRVLKKFPK